MALVKAKLIIDSGTHEGQEIPVQFNPQSLQVTYQAIGVDGSKNKHKDAETNGSMDQTTGSISQISMDLLFDTSENGKDVRNATLLLVSLLRPDIIDGNPAPAPPRVIFSWGAFLFMGKVLSLSETIDFFSEQGVPLRSTVKLNMSELRRDRSNAGVLAALNVSIGIGLSASAGVSAGVGLGAGFSASASLSAGIAVGTTPLTLAQAGDSLQALAGRAGVDASWKAIAAANNIDNPRAITPGTPINLSAGASASASLGTGS